jgi:hypothetical protein
MSSLRFQKASATVFDVGLNSYAMTHSFIPPNHYKSQEHHDFILTKYSSEIALNHISHGYEPSFLESLIGPFHTAPLNVVEQNGKLHATIDHSYLCDSLIQSFN